MSSARSARASTTQRSSTSGTAVSRRSKSPDILQQEQPGLRRVVQQRLLKDVFETTSEKHPGWKVLIVDQHAMRVISSAVGMYDIMERKVTLVESLEKKRAPFPDMAAIYVLEPSSSSVRTLISDFSNPTKPLYGKAVFLYFLGRLSDSLLNEIKACTPLLKRIKSLTEMNIDFLAREERAFTFAMPTDETFASIYLRQTGQSQQPAELIIAQKLVTVCGTLNEYPHIRYKHDSAVCSSLASLFKIKMDEFVSQNPSWWYHGGPSKASQGGSAAMRERGTLLLLDRADDLLSPLMHDFTYQAMVHDLIPMEGDRVTVTSGAESSKDETKDVLLDEKDNIWVELRGMHIAAVIETLSNRIREIMNSSTGSTLAGSKTNGNDGGTLSLSQMAAALKALPEYQEVLSKLSQHMHLSHQCMDNFGAQQLLAVAEIEQTLATGKDEDGKSPKIADIMDQVESMLVKMKSHKEKIRLILICILTCSGLRTQDKRRLYAAAELTAKETRILQESLDVFGMSIFNENDKNRTISGLPGRLAPDEESQYAATRYVPAIKSVLTSLCNDELSLDDYPSVTPMPIQSSNQAGRNSAVRNSAVTSARKSTSGAASSVRKTVGASSKWAANSSSLSSSSTSSKNGRTGGPTAFTGSRCIVFMIGGLSFPELRVSREVMEQTSREIILGSTSFLSANDFMEDLNKLSR